MILKRVFVNSIIVFSSVSAGLLSIEVCLQLFRLELPYQYMPQKIVRSFFKESKKYEFTLKPNYKGKFIMTSASFDSIIRTNSLGWRDEEPDEREKVFVFGDSFVFGFGLNNIETIPAHLEKLDNGKRDFVNLGFTAGRSPDSYLNYLRQNKDVQNKPIILLIYNNDLNDISNNNYFDFQGRPIQLDDSSMYEVRGNLSYIRDGDLFERKSFITANLPLKVIYWLKQSYIVALLRFATDKALNYSSQEVTVIQEATERETFSQNYKNEIGSFIKSLSGMANYSSNISVFTIGSKQGFEISEFYKEVAKICDGLKLSYFHIPSFDSSHYFKRDSHYNQKGAKKAASYIYKHLKKINYSQY